MIYTGTAVTLNAGLAIGANSVAQVNGQVIAASTTAVASGAALIANSGSVLTLNGGITVDAGASGSNQGVCSLPVCARVVYSVVMHLTQF